MRTEILKCGASILPKGFQTRLREAPSALSQVPPLVSFSASRFLREHLGSPSELDDSLPTLVLDRVFETHLVLVNLCCFSPRLSAALEPRISSTSRNICVSLAYGLAPIG